MHHRSRDLRGCTSRKYLFGVNKDVTALLQGNNSSCALTPWPCHCNFTIFLEIRCEMLDGQRADNLSILKKKSALRHNFILPEYLCLQKPGFPWLVWALA